jgi:NagD protein
MSAENTPSTTTPTTDTRELAAHFAATLGQLSSPASNTEEPAHQSKDYALLRDPVLHNERLDSIRQKKGYIIDMDGVIYHVSERWAKKKKKKLS